jgi:hypothetical protein
MSVPNFTRLRYKDPNFAETLNINIWCGFEYLISTDIILYYQEQIHGISIVLCKDANR